MSRRPDTDRLISANVTLDKGARIFGFTNRYGCALIGSNATLLCGITVGEGVHLGAGTGVTEDVPAGAVVGGNPTRVMQRQRASLRQLTALAATLR